ncbi:uncharacterized protein [Primulina huaijiensis]|uniref:uncharacterized protein n=1 Tax=Primulina huaijiensis TaxID=1492673 RepID=UPI003CC722D6
MQTLIYRKPFFSVLRQHLPSSFCLSQNLKNKNFLINHPKNCPNSSQTLLLCSVTSNSISYGGWDDFRLKGDSTHSGDSTQLNNFLSYLGIGDKKYLFVYLFGFVCALAISRVKVSSIVVFPACAVVFAIGFSIGLVKKGDGKELKSNGNRRKLPDENFSGFVEKLRNLKDVLNGYNAKVLSLKNEVKRSIKDNKITVNDLEGYIDVIESNDVALQNALNVVDSCLHYEGDFDHETIRKRKKLGENGFNFSQVFGGLFQEKFGHLKRGKVKDSGKGEFMDADVDNQKRHNILVDFVEDINLDSVLNGNLGNQKDGIYSEPFDSNSRSKNVSENHVNGTVAKNEVFKHWKKNFADKNGSVESFSERPAFSYQNNKSRFVTNQQYYFKDYQDETEAMASRSGMCSSVDFSFTMKHTKNTSSFDHQQMREVPDGNYWYSESTEDDRVESHRYSVKQKPFGPGKPTSFVNQEHAHANIFGSPPPPILDIDLEFNRCLEEANDILKEAKRCLRNQVANGFSENTLYESAALLSKAIEMRPMSLLAVGQLGNTYLLHGELKLKMSRELRSLLTRSDSFSVEVGSVLCSFGDQLSDKEKIKLVLADVCEECEELLVKAGRKYRVALSIDGNDMRALYNWGLALSFRAQLIADIGPSTARDADKIFMAAIDKFDAIMNKGNNYAPDALFKWGSVLLHRSRLRPRNSREKVRLLQQAQRLFEDALHLDSGNPQLEGALSTCLSEIDHWYG